MKLSHLFSAFVTLFVAAEASAATMYLSNGSHIDQFTSGGVRSVFANTVVSGAQGLAFDTAGNLYVANSGNNTIEEFTPGGFG